MLHEIEIIEGDWNDAQIMAENTVNEEENINSKSSQLEEEDLQKLEADSEKLPM